MSEYGATMLTGLYPLKLNKEYRYECKEESWDHSCCSYFGDSIYCDCFLGYTEKYKLLYADRQRLGYGDCTAWSHELQVHIGCLRCEVLEETGLHIDLLPMFSCRSSYTIQGRVEKQVTISC